MTLEEIQAEATKLPPEDRSLLASRLLQDREVERYNHERLRADIELGLDQIARGEVHELKTDEERRAFFKDIKARGRQRLAEDKKPT
jgi:hypothetical protein